MSNFSEIAAAVSQTSKIVQALQNERETGSGSKGPILSSVDEYPYWKDRFKTYVEGTAPVMWSYLEGGYTRPKNERNQDLVYEEMNEAQRREFDAERKAYLLLTQALSKQTHHQFNRFKTASSLWTAIEEWYEGNAEIRSMQGRDYQREFDNFCAFKGESLNDTVERYWHLLSQMASYGITPNSAITVEQLANALPEKWGPYLMVQRQSNLLDGVSITDFVIRLRKEELIEKRRLKQQQFAQDPASYGATSDKSVSSHTPLKISGMVSQSSPPVQSQGHLPSSSSTGTSSTNPFAYTSTDTAGLKTENINKTSAESIQNHMGLLTTLVNSYDDLLAGRTGNIYLEREDYDQIDKDEMERMDIMWGMANLVRRADEYKRKTGKEVRIKKDSKYGFDMSAVTCYNCGEKGHFARQCTKPKKAGNQSPFKPRSSNQESDNSKSVVRYSQNSQSQSLNVVQTDEGANWTEMLNETTDQATSVAIVADDCEGQVSDEEDEVDDLYEYANRLLSGDEEGVGIVSPSSEREAARAAEVTESASTATPAPATASAFMADPSDAKQVCDCKSKPCDNCLTLEARLSLLQISNDQYKAELDQNRILKDKERQFQAKIDILDTQVRDLEATVLRKQRACTAYIDTIGALKRENAIIRADYETLDQKIKSYNNSSYLLDVMLSSGQTGRQGLGYGSVPPPYSHIPRPSADDELELVQPPASESKDHDSAETKPLKPPTFPDPSKPVESQETSTEKCKSPEVEEAVVGTITKSKPTVILRKINGDSGASTSTTSLSKPVIFTKSGAPEKLKKMNFENLKPVRPKVQYVAKTNTGNVNTEPRPVPQPQPRPQPRPEPPVQRSSTRPRERPQGRAVERTRDTFQQSPSRNNRRFPHNAEHLQKPVVSSKSKPSKGQKFNVPQGSNKSDRRCYECGGVGHEILVCPNLLKLPSTQANQHRKSPVRPTGKDQTSPPRVVEKRTCYRCGELGHVVQDCPTLARVFKRSDDSPKRTVRHTSPAKVQGRVTKVKGKTTQSSRSSDLSHSASHEKSVNKKGKPRPPPSGKWVEISMPDENRKPKTTLAWVPLSN